MSSPKSVDHRVLARLCEGPASRYAIVEDVGCNYHTVVNSIRRLLSVHLIERRGTAKSHRENGGGVPVALFGISKTLKEAP